MKCFYHADRDAVGVCKSCQRALCHECAADVGKGIACTGRCEEDARQLIQLTDAAIRHQPANEFIVARIRRNRIASALLYIVLGAGFVGTGIIHPFIWFIAFLGGIFVLFGLYILTQLPRLQQTAIRDHAKI
jgi:hypothetical protein